MKYGVQITTLSDDSWSVSQLVQKIKNGEFSRTKTQGVIYIDYSNPGADQELLAAIRNGLRGKIHGASSPKHP